ncbi:alpha/beta hydrolase [Gaoshiqia sp. Z1-71]|uniref:alpha/beta hydrolase n=1 Tax=Gaoshiqia hydrogeniformans TaxID=3290090 RepID=UPI003BF81971
MKYLIYPLFILSIGFTKLAAQERYLEEITDSVEFETFTYIEKAGQQLRLDVYLPAFDAEQERPVLLYVHGGGFSGGTRDNEGIKTFCSKVARRGYVAVSISYRLTRKDTETKFGCDCPATEKLATFSAAVEDVQDATYFLIENRELFGIDPQQIILAGSSAGAEAILNAGYEPPYCYGLDSGPVSYAGLVSMAGAIPDTAKIYDDSAIPSMFFHGTCDNLVPYGTASHHYCDEKKPGYLVLNGSQAIAEKLRLLGKPYWLHTTCGGNHALAGTPMTAYFDEIMQFCYDFVLHGSKDQIHTIVAGEHACGYPAFNYCSDGGEKKRSSAR